MLEMLKQLMQEWHKNNDRLAKLQGLYVVIGLMLLVVAGLASLANQQLGRTLLEFAKYGGLAFVANFVTWTLFDSLFLAKLPVAKSKTKAGVKNKSNIKKK